MLKKLLFIIMLVCPLFEAWATGQTELPSVRKPKAFQGINRNLLIPFTRVKFTKIQDQ